jgi:hypothetical protein
MWQLIRLCAARALPRRVDVVKVYVPDLLTGSSPPLMVQRDYYLNYPLNSLYRYLDTSSITSFTMSAFASLYLRQNAAPSLAPPGVVPNFVNPDSIGGRVVVACPLLGAIAVIFVALRFLVKLRILKNWGYEDRMSLSSTSEPRSLTSLYGIVFIFLGLVGITVY